MAQQFICKTPNVQFSGKMIYDLVTANKSLEGLWRELFAEEGMEEIKPDDWYPFQSFLNTYKVIQEQVGENVLFNIGKVVNTKIDFPPELDSLDKVLATLDIAYHMTMRLNGESMFNSQSGEMRDGIGHYSFKSAKDNCIIMYCDNPSPCDIDRGILTGFARRFYPMAEVNLDTSVANRKDGAEGSTYIIKW